MFPGNCGGRCGSAHALEIMGMAFVGRKYLVVMGQKHHTRLKNSGSWLHNTG